MDEDPHDIEQPNEVPGREGVGGRDPLRTLPHDIEQPYDIPLYRAYRDPYLYYGVIRSPPPTPFLPPCIYLSGIVRGYGKG